MGRFVVGAERDQTTLFPPCLGDWIAEDNPVRVVDAFVDAVDLGALGFEGADAARTGRPGYHPAALLKLYVYGYLNRVPSSRRLEREAGRNVEVMWLTGRLSPDHKTIAEFRRQNGFAIGRVCARFVALCREMGLLTGTRIAIDGSKFKAVNNRDRNFTQGKLDRRRQQIEESGSRYLSQLDTADRQDPTPELAAKVVRLKEKIARLGQEMERLAGLEEQMKAAPDRADLADRSRRALDGNERARIGLGGLQRPGGGRDRASSHRRAHGHECRLGPGATQRNGRAGQAGPGDGHARCGGRPWVLLRPRDSRLRTRRHLRHIAPAHDVRRQGGRTLRQGGFPLPS